MKLTLSIILSVITGAALYIVSSFYISGMTPLMSSSLFSAVPLTLILNIIVLIKIKLLKQRLVATSILLIVITVSVISGQKTWSDHEEVFPEYEEYRD